MLDFCLNLLFNIHHNTSKELNMSDKQVILDLGGISAVARLLKTSPQRVWNWTKRGIPARMKIAHPELFLKDKKHMTKAKMKQK